MIQVRFLARLLILGTVHRRKVRHIPSSCAEVPCGGGPGQKPLRPERAIAMPEITQCPSCQRTLNVPDGCLGLTVRCPACGAGFTAERYTPPRAVPTANPQPQANAQQQQQPMRDHLHFICPHCLSAFHGDYPVGEQTRCTNCGRVFNIRPHVGNQDSPWSVIPGASLFSGIGSILAGKKCPVCKCRGNVEYLGRRYLGQQYVGGSGPVYVINVGEEYYQCNSCNRSFSLSTSAPA